MNGIRVDISLEESASWIGPDTATDPATGRTFRETNITGVSICETCGALVFSEREWQHGEFHGPVDEMDR